MITTALKLAALILITCYYNYCYYTRKLEIKEKQLKCIKVGKTNRDL